MTLTERLDRFQQSHPWAGFPLAVIYKFVDDQGTFLAALITYYGFLSSFPLLLLLTSALGAVLRGDPGLRDRVVDSALSQFPIIGDQLGNPAGLGGTKLGVILGIAGCVYGGLGIGQAIQNAMNVVWAVPRHRRPNPLRSRARGLLLLATVGAAVLATTVLSALGTSAEQFGASVGLWAKILLTLASVAVNAVVFVVGFRITTARRLPLRDIVPGALAAAVVWQVLQSVGAVYVGHVVKGASATNGVFAVVLGLVAWIYLEAVTIVLCAEVNAVRAQRLYPRALLSAFTDDADLTSADQRSYAQSATAQRATEQEDVDVRFDRETRN
ncbi:MAG: YihY/virulence factor BrkB family protein [Actinomycetota bacterium]|nr:YihY/virulence factor BrkB family protein [Actinomycetota bacterium]